MKNDLPEPIDLETLLKFEVKPDPRYAEFRIRLIAQKLQGLEQAPAHPGWLRVFRVGFVAALLFLVFVLPQQMNRPHVAKNSNPPAEVPFELQKVDDVVKLTWKADPNDEYRIYKGSTPSSLRPVQSVRGDEWIDRSSDSSPITFYRIEPL